MKNDSALALFVAVVSGLLLGIGVMFAIAPTRPSPLPPTPTPTLTATRTPTPTATATSTPSPTELPIHVVPSPRPERRATPSAECSSDEIAKARDSIEKMTEAQSIHQSWIDAERSGSAPATAVAIAGDVAWQQQWVDNYTEVLGVLDAYLALCVARS